MTDFEFDTPRSLGTNRSAATTECETCGGDRFVLVDDTDGYETYIRCGTCNPPPVRESVPTDSWWKDR